MDPVGALLAAVRPGSPAARAGLRAGDRVTAVDGVPVADALDAAWAIAQEAFRLSVRRGGRTLRGLMVRRRPGQPWGGTFEPPAVRRCGNRCPFCFVDQMPPGLRPGLYVKDEDYRHSFLYGNYVTLSRFSARDLERVLRQRLSPLYVSVHATMERVRRRLLGRRDLEPILPLLRVLTAGRITVHAQAVICPGWNDGAVLERTVSDLARLHPGVASLALVPVGLSAHRQGLVPLRRSTAAEARALLRRLDAWQARFRRSLGTRLVYATDEWYLRAGRAVPATEAYEGFPQIENGVGLTRRFLDQTAEVLRRLPARVWPSRRVLIPSGELAAPIVRHALAPLARVRGLAVEVVAVPNRLFGRSVTVTGLLAGADVLAALTPRVRADTRVLLPAVMVREGHGRFLDDLAVRGLHRRLGVPVRVVATPGHLVRAVIS